jgi:hypothetical protein
MSQRLQAAMLDISSSRHQYQHQQHLQQITPQASTSLLPPVQAGAVGAVQVQTSCVAEEPEEHGPRRGKESICCGSQSTSSRAASKKMQQQHSQHRSQPLPSPHPLMPALLEKVRAAASLPPETVSQSHASKQQSQLRPKERFKGPHDCSFTPQFLIPSIFCDIRAITQPTPCAGAVVAVIGSIRVQEFDSALSLPLISPPSPPPKRFNTLFRPPAPCSRALAQDPKSDFLCETEAESGTDQRRKSDPGPPPNSRLVYAIPSVKLCMIV